MKEDSKPKKTNASDHCFREDFKYPTQRNPYHQKLDVFNEFVLKDEEAEVHRGKWSEDVFKNQAPIEVEIGSGYGHFMLDYTEKNPGINFIGLDHRFKRSFHLAEKLAKREHKNFRYLRARGERLGFIFGEEEVSKLYYFFPDPWPKKRHHKKRLFQQTFIKELYKVMKKDGEVLIKTDHDGYYEWMLEELKDNQYFEITFNSQNLREEHPEHFLASFITKFEKIFLNKGIKIKAITLKKK
ncbi:MAG: tRNA (guanosine(46)-N7)-methyltransferase TrmB [Halobacteriovoraceae bacterium]|nr:tRNA (guanosine(46)-N7)-methyltransferase TrmB [Halobacteriovoraceae bacterium]|tara:strand:- start:3089 stop:3811 length:723 start_codon:yes stop_codon:yes gene_type:complete